MACKGRKKFPKSQKQARLLGAVAGGVKTGATGMSKKKAKAALRGKKVAKLPK